MVPLKNSTFATDPFVSLAAALMITLAGAKDDALLVGEVIETVGAGFVTVIATGAEVAVAPKLSVAFVVKV
ncbi:hypothetical protein D3C84_1216790 [compost metagenome]